MPCRASGAHAAPRPRARARLPDRHGQCAGRAVILICAAEEHGSAPCCSTTGRRATCGPGSSPAARRPFLSKNFATTISPWVVTPRRAGAVPRALRACGDQPQPSPTRSRLANRLAAPSTSCSRSVCRRRRCARRRAAPVADANEFPRFTDRRPASSPTTPSAAATSVAATCSARGTQSGPGAGAARCWSERRRQEADHAGQRRDANLPVRRRQHRTRRPLRAA